MPNYEEIIEQSQANVKLLGEKLKDIDKLHHDIIELTKQPEIFDKKYQQILKLSSDYTNTLGIATQKYLDGNNTLFTSKLGELSTKIKEFENEITRLVKTDFISLFKVLQKDFINQSRKDLQIELKRFEEKSNDFQLKIASLEKQVERLENVDLNEHFDEIQKQIRTNRIIQIFGLSVVVIIILIYILLN